jgi:gliding motility-associated-like protein
VQETQSQVCTTLGQTPATAFPVCGTTTFTQSTVPLCANGAIIAPGCEGIGSPYPEKNPFWYKFTCYQSGTLNFALTPPAGQDEDYDWELFDITGLPVSSVYTNTSTIVTYNWSGTYGATGASGSGSPTLQCASDPTNHTPSFALSPNLIIGHEYLLLVSHFTDNQSGYVLSFDGGTAVITDPTEPHLANARAACDGTVMHIKLNKKMKCSSLAADGSDFSINTPLTAIIGASGVGCSTGFDTDSIVLTLNNPLPPGNYIITIKNGSDGNTLKDNCDRTIPVGENRTVVVYPVFPTPMDSLTKPGCAPQSLELVFRKPIRCSSVAADGSDFVVTGPYPVTVTAASGNCGPSGLSNKIIVQLSAPMQVAGTFQIRLVIGSDGTTIIDECGQPSNAAETISFTVSDTVNADFTYNVAFGCKTDVINYAHNGNNGVNSWRWTFDNSTASTLQNPQQTYPTFGQKLTRLIVSNGVCSDTTAVSIFLDNYMKAGFESLEFVCPNDPALFKDTSIGNIARWTWTFGNGSTSILQSPLPQHYVVNPTSYNAVIKLVVENNIGCKDSVSHIIHVINNCYIAVPSAFTPNGDGLNDYLYPLNAYEASDLDFSVYNRFGQRIFYTTDWTNKWDGTFKGQGADPGTYVWMLRYTNIKTHKRVEQRGNSILIR